MPPRFVCKECKKEVWKPGGHKKLELCNRCYIKYLRSEPTRCTICGRIANSRRKHEPICSNCEATIYAKKYWHSVNNRYLECKNEVHKRLKEYWMFLNDRLGDRVKPIYEAFYPIEKLLGSGEINLDWSWAELESFRNTQGVHFKAAIHVYMRFLSQNGLIEGREDKRFEFLFKKTVQQLPNPFNDILKRYIEFCLKKRKLSNWTTYLISKHLKEFFTWLHDASIDSLASLSSRDIVNFLSSLREKVSQKTIYNDKRVIDDFFKWAKQNRLVFRSPSLSVDVKCPPHKPKGLPFSEQKRLVQRWMDDNCDPQESIVGMLSLFYGLSNEELRSLKVRDFDLVKHEICLEKRPVPLGVADEIILLLKKYLAFRDSQLNDSSYEYLVFSNYSVTLNQPVNHLSLNLILKPANVNLRSLRASCLIDTALSGNVKVLELLGLSIEGCKPYLNIIKDALAQKELKINKEK